MAEYHEHVACRTFLFLSLFVLVTVSDCFVDDCRERIPNGHRIPFQARAGGHCPKKKRPVAPPSCYGGAITVHDNPFGKDFAAAGYKWTRKLCGKDSDGDGLSNGEELGDPCCIWHENAEAPLWMGQWSVSHPGFTNSSGAFNQSGLAASSLCESTKRLPDKSPYNKDEDVVELDYTMPFNLRYNDANPKQDMLVFQDFQYNFPGNATYDIVGIDRWFDNEEILDYLVSHIVASCRQRTGRQGGFVGVDAFENQCLETMYMWQRGRGKLNFTTPKSTGFRAGKGTTRTGFRARLVYRAPPSAINITSIKSGLRFHTTNTLRKHELGTIRMDVRTRMELIPPQSKVAVSNLIQIVVDERVAPDGVKLVGYLPRPPQHLSTCKRWAERLKRANRRKGLLRRMTELDKDVELGRDVEWFDDDSSLSLHTSDYIASTCIYDSSTVATSTELEGCDTALYYYPANAMDQILRYSGPNLFAVMTDEEANYAASYVDILTFPSVPTTLPLWRELYLNSTFRCNPFIVLANLNSTQQTPGVTDSLFQLEVSCKKSAGLAGLDDKKRLQFQCTDECAIIMYNMMACALVKSSRLKSGELLSLFPSPLENVAHGICGKTFAGIYERFTQGTNMELISTYGLAHFDMAGSPCTPKLTTFALIVVALLTRFI